jgi:outer membrane protein assembly factor BamB
MPRRVSPASRLTVLVFSLVALAAAGRMSAAEPDPVEGKWLGSGGPPEETVQIGLEFFRDAQGALKVKLTQPEANYFSMEAQGPVRREGNRVELQEMGIDLELRDGELVGVVAGPRSRVSLHRVSSLPQEAPIPDLPPGPGPKWQAQLGAAMWAAPAVWGDTAYVGTVGGVFQAVGKEGKIEWTFSAGHPIYGEALATADAVYFVCDDGALYKLDRAKGTQVWRYELGDAGASRVLPHPQVYDYDYWSPKPALADGALYVGSGDGGFHAVDEKSGARRWRFQAGARVRNGALVDGPRVVFGAADSLVYALDRGTGKELWRRDLKAPIDTAPVALDGKVLIGNRGPGVHALAAETGEIVWRTPFWGSWVESTPVVREGVVYVGSSDLTRVSAIDGKDGRVLWRSNVFGWAWGTPLLDGGRIYIGVAGVEPYFIRHVAGVAALDQRSGRVLWRWPYPKPQGAFVWGFASSPVKAGDSILLAGLDGTLYAFPAS